MLSFLARRLAALAVIGALALMAAACGSDASTTTLDDSASDESAADDSASNDSASNDSAEMSDDDMSDMAADEHAGHGDDGEHHHSEMLEVDAASAPTVDIEIVEDPKSGFNVRVTTTDFTVSPANASTEHVDGEGHMHLLVDGVKQRRFYNDWIHVSGLDAGEHMIEVELNANTHAPYAVDGERIAASQMVMVDEADAHDHGDSETIELSLDDVSMSVDVAEDPLGGWNVTIVPPGDFVVSPESASTEHVDGEGHMHLVIDGVKQGRVYGPWIYVPDQGAGEHVIEVELSANDHRAYSVNGTVVAAQATVSGGELDDVPTDAPDVLVVIDYTDGEITLDSNGSDSDRIDAPLGSNVRLTITSDVAEHIHVHGYDLFVDLVPGESAVLDFVAEIPGLLEVELEDSRTFLFELSTQ